MKVLLQKGRSVGHAQSLMSDCTGMAAFCVRESAKEVEIT